MPATVQPALPFGGDPVAEIPLPSTPLIVVIAQIRFPAITSISREDFIGPFQERIRSRYPVLRQEHEMGLLVGPKGFVPSAATTPVWRFQDKADTWRVSLAPEFVALDTSAYVSRADFLSRLGEVLQAVADVISPATFDRLGVRYVDRLSLDGPTDLGDLVRPEIYGVATSDLGTAQLIHSVCDAEFSIEDAILHGRWGVVPPNVILEPLHRRALPVASWLLDLDMYTLKADDFNTQTVLRRTEAFTKAIYQFFRWAVRDKLLREAGGEL